MALIPKVEPKQEKKVVSARLDEEAHTMLQRYAAFLGGATHEYRGRETHNLVAAPS